MVLQYREILFPQGNHLVLVIIMVKVTVLIKGIYHHVNYIIGLYQQLRLIKTIMQLPKGLIYLQIHYRYLHLI